MKRLRTKLDLNQWRSTQEVIDWFNGLENKHELKFIKFDIDYQGIAKQNHQMGKISGTSPHWMQSGHELRDM